MLEAGVKRVLWRSNPWPVAVAMSQPCTTNSVSAIFLHAELERSDPGTLPMPSQTAGSSRACPTLPHMLGNGVPPVWFEV